jgi:hypothetical protein
MAATLDTGDTGYKETSILGGLAPFISAYLGFRPWLVYESHITLPSQLPLDMIRELPTRFAALDLFIPYDIG